MKTAWEGDTEKKLRELLFLFPNARLLLTKLGRICQNVNIRAFTK